MKYYLNDFNIKNLKYDLINKFSYQTTKSLPEFKKIILNFGCKTTNLKELASSLLAIELITKQKGKLTTTKQANIVLKIREGYPVGCKVVLRKKLLFKFLNRITNEVFPKSKDFRVLPLNRDKNTRNFSYELSDTFAFSELEKHYYLFNNLTKLSATIVTNSSNTEELTFILKSFKFPV
jgi:large subunit ribosomal protein L5